MADLLGRAWRAALAEIGVAATEPARTEQEIQALLAQSARILEAARADLGDDAHAQLRMDYVGLRGTVTKQAVETRKISSRPARKH